MFNRSNIANRGGIPVPNLRGLTSNQAALAIGARGLRVGRITLIDHDHPPWAPADIPHVVVDQNPPAGAVVAPGTAMTVWLNHSWI